MKAPLILGLGITFFFFVPLGIYTNIFPFVTIGLTGAGLSFTLYSLKIKNDWKGFNRLQKLPFIGSSVVWIYRLGILGLGAVALYSATSFWADSPAYIKKNYAKIEGIPSKIVYEKATLKSQIEGTITVIINNKRLSIAPNPHYPIKNNVEGRHFLINYLPNTEWVMDYTIE
ncbi:hypothetical protein [Neobacillus sp. SuZ13]|uniref:hypothetical protein n=1 Tax=Neobacillus sp. SuZ13 TaxID=3047875 RepID=UPI0024BF6E13|nr:hypothetical protein [Neobacillus sp. SuZ13]WHY69353.1 hypothetical protein QNH17_12225 [Neobacillus sp. SuZ13]